MPDEAWRAQVDFMQYDEEILGFSNRWYAKGIETAVETSLDENITIRHLTPPMFIATKLEAYRGRGGGDLIGSRDAEDILLLVDGRQELVDEVAAADADIRSYIAGEFKRRLSDRDFDHFLEGNIRGPEGRADIVRDRFIAGSATAHMACNPLAKPARNDRQPGLCRNRHTSNGGPRHRP